MLDETLDFFLQRLFSMADPVTETPDEFHIIWQKLIFPATGVCKINVDFLKEARFIRRPPSPITMLSEKVFMGRPRRIHVYFAAPCTHSFQFYFQHCGWGVGVAPWCKFWSPRLFCRHRYPENPETRKMKPRWAGEKYGLVTHWGPIENKISHLCLHLLQRASFIWRQPASAVKHTGIAYVSLPPNSYHLLRPSTWKYRPRYILTLTANKQLH